MSSKRIRIDYYTVNLRDNPGTSFEEILKQLMKLKSTLAQRNIKAYDHYIRLQNIEFNKDIVKERVYIGTLLRIRMNDLPLKVGLDNGIVDFLPLNDEEGLGEQTFFLYAPSVNVLLFHNGRDGVKASGFAYYFESVATDIKSIELEPVIEKDVIEKLVNFNIIRKFQVKFAKPKNPELYKKLGVGVQTLVKLMDDDDAAVLSLEMSLGKKKKGTMKPQNIIAKAKGILKIHSEHSEEVEKLIVTGKRYDDEASEPLDLLKHRIKDFVSIKQENRRISQDDCYEKLANMYNKRKKELKAMFGRPK